MKRYLIGGLLVIFTLWISSCDRIHEEIDGSVEIYLLEDFETIDQTCRIKLSSVTIKQLPIIRYEEIESYNSSEYLFKISDEAVDKIDSLEHSVFGIAFAVTADKEIIYTGYFWPSYSSLGCQWIIIDPLMWRGDNELRIELGYPGRLQGVEIPDERNNEKILEIFRRDGKLID
jgi:hypothetical protein